MRRSRGFGFEHADGVAVGERGADRGEVGRLLGKAGADGLQHQRLAGDVQGEPSQLPVVSGDFGLFEGEGSSLVEAGEDAEAKVDVGDEGAGEPDEALLAGVDPDFAGDAAQQVGFKVRRIPAGSGGKAETEAFAGAARHGSLGLVDERVGQQSHEV